MNNIPITEWCHRMIREAVSEGDLCVDATVGNGNDTQLLCQLAGPSGTVHGFDIQEQAIVHTKERLNQLGLSAELHLCSHTNMREWILPGTASCIVFNFGYLPGGDHALATQKDTSIEAIHQGLALLKVGGLMSLCIYSGGDTGFEERDAILAYLENLDTKQYLVIVSNYYNRKNHPPIPAFIIRLKG